MVTGEELYTKTEFRDAFEKRATDVINPDVCNCGGILELREIAPSGIRATKGRSDCNFRVTYSGNCPRSIQPGFQANL